jgi:predicted nuclease of restriction endonuclease-like (RecB) superfamily
MFENLDWYFEECIRSGWSGRQLERPISTLYLDRLLAGRDKTPVKCQSCSGFRKIGA